MLWTDLQPLERRVLLSVAPGLPGLRLVDPDVDDLGGHYVVAMPGEIHGTKWEDLNGDGVRDVGEPGLADVTIYIDANANGQLDDGETSTVTMPDDTATADVDETGLYWLTGLAPGTHVVREVVPAGYEQTFPNAAADYVFFDDFDDANYAGWTVANALNPDAPVFAPDIVASPEGYAIRGVNSGYSQPGLATHLVQPLSLSNVGELTIEIRAISGPQWPNQASVDLLSGSDIYRALDYGESNHKADCYSVVAGGSSNQYRHSIGERAHEWHDYTWTRDADGWWSLLIDGQSEAADFLQDNQLTTFDQIGLSVLRNQSEVEWLRVTATHASDGHNVTLTPGQTVAGIDFGNRQIAGEIHGLEWEDLDGDSVRDAGEPGLAGVTVYLDQNHDHHLNDGDLDLYVVNGPGSAGLYSEQRRRDLHQCHIDQQFVLQDQFQELGVTELVAGCLLEAHLQGLSQAGEPQLCQGIG